MKNSILNFCNRTVEYSFYALFLLVPLVFAGNTSELFELNKIWITYGIAVLIAFSWFSKMLILKKPVFKRTPLDIPILLFLISQIISTIFSLDSHVSFWGYYSRFNGGLLSTITYIFLYFAFVSNFFRIDKEENTNNKRGFPLYQPDGITVVKKSLLVSLISGLIAVLWALPSHFGYDPTCLVFRGALDVSCWTADFQPKIRIFGPLGQPDWLAGYLGILIPVAGAFILKTLRQTKNLRSPRLLFYALCFLLFYLSLLYTGSRSGIIATFSAIFIFAVSYLFFNRKNLNFFKNKFFAVFIILFLLVSFFAGIRLPVVDRFSFSEVQKILTRPDPTSPAAKPTESAVNQTLPPGIELGGSDSFRIRKIVWEGAINTWRANPIFGTGVETFAYAYYKYRPVEHNLLSEWNFLYNKAHNEYLNYLATTGAFGLLSYLSFIALFFVIATVKITNKANFKNKYLNFLNSDTQFDPTDPIPLALIASFISILIINFFGFSVVILNIYLFLIPAFILVWWRYIKDKEIKPEPDQSLNYSELLGISTLGIVGIFIVIMLMRSWYGDTKYALGANYQRAGEYQTAYPLLQDAVKIRKEPVFEDEMAVNSAVMAVGLASQKATESAQLVQTLAKQALETSDKLTKKYPHNVVYWKSRVRILYTLSQFDPRFMPLTLEAIKKTAELAPTDASVLYNLGVLYGQNNDSKKAIEVLEKTVTYRPHYIEAHYALGLFYHDLGVKPDSSIIINSVYHDKAINEMKYILEKLNPEFKQAKESLDLWEKER